MLVNILKQHGCILLWCVFSFLQRHAVHKLYGAPQPVELVALVNVHHPIHRHLPAEDGVGEEALDATHDHLKHGETTAQALLSQQITILGIGHLLGRNTKLQFNFLTCTLHAQHNSTICTAQGSPLSNQL